MPADLLAHRASDKAVDAAYGAKALDSDAKRVAYLFQRYREYTGILAA